MRILFVCLGNICRSPTAEGVMRAKLIAAGLAGHVEVASAGTGDWHVGKAPDERTQRAAKARGYDLSAQRAQQVTEADWREYDLLLAMDHTNLASIERLRPDDATAQAALFLRHCQAPVDEVPDPYYGGSRGFDEVLDLVENACDRLILSLGKRG